MIGINLSQLLILFGETLVRSNEMIIIMMSQAGMGVRKPVEPVEPLQTKLLSW